MNFLLLGEKGCGKSCSCQCDGDDVCVHVIGVCVHSWIQKEMSRKSINVVTVVKKSSKKKHKKEKIPKKKKVQNSIDEFNEEMRLYFDQLIEAPVQTQPQRNRIVHQMPTRWVEGMRKESNGGGDRMCETEKVVF